MRLQPGTDVEWREVFARATMRSDLLIDELHKATPGGKQ